jgi:putative flippase GtrA
MTGKTPVRGTGAEVTGEAETTQTGAEARPAWSASHPRQAILVYLISYAVIALAGARLVAVLSSPIALGAAVTGVAGAALAASLLLVLSLCRVRMRPAAELGWVLAMTFVFAMARPSVFQAAGRLLGQPAIGERAALALSFLPASVLLGNVALIVWATFLGRLVSRLIREGKLILPVAVVASVADIVTVFWGVIAHVSETAPEVAEAFSTSAPVEAPPGIAAPILSMVGIGDFLFLALFLAVALRYSFQPTKTVWATFGLMLLAPLGFFVVPAATGLPGLPFISAAVLWANWRHLDYTREEKKALAVAGVLVVVLAVSSVTFLRR